MTIKICGKEWDIEEVRKMYENDFDTRKEWCQALGHKQGTHFKQLIKKLDFKEEDFGKNREHIYKKQIHVGDRFGKLVVIEPNYQQDKYDRWESLCQCDCGAKKIVGNNDLKTGNTTSCGCIVGRDEKNKIKNGDIFGYLTIIDANNYYLNGKISSKCVCKCGKEKIIRNACLRAGSTVSCGCKSGNNEENKIKNGDVYNYLTVIDANNYHLNNKLSSKCICKCGKEKIIRNADLRNGAITSCGCRRISIGESKIKDFLNTYGVKYKAQYRFSDLRGINNGTLFFDFAVFNNKDELNCLIEYQGEQHYMPIEIFGGEEAFKRQKENDLLKRQYCLERNIKLIEIPYFDREIMEEKYLLDIKD